MDNNGNKLYACQFGTSGDDMCWGITTDEALNIYLCGTTSGDLAEKNKGQNDAFVGKFNATGEQIKLIQFGTAGYDAASRIVVDKEKCIYTGGSTAGDLAGKQQGQSDNYIAKISEKLEIT